MTLARRFRILTVGMLLLLALAGPLPAAAQGQDIDDNRWLGSGDLLSGLIQRPTDRDRYYFTGQAQTTASIYMRGFGDVDPYLVLVAPDSSWVAIDDNNGRGIDAYIETTLLQNGTYTIIARDSELANTGSYDLGLGLRGGVASTDPDDARWLSAADVQGGGIVPASDEDFYYVTGRAGQTVFMTMLGTQDVDPYLLLVSPEGGPLASDDNSGTGNNAAIVATLPQDGTYLVVASSAGGATTGRYELYSNLAPGDLAGEQEGGEWLTVNNRLNGTVNALEDEDAFYFRGRADRTVSLYMAGFGGLDSYLILIAPDGSWIATDNNSGANMDAAITVTLPENGVYTIVARNFASTTIGRYALSLLEY